MSPDTRGALGTFPHAVPRSFGRIAIEVTERLVPPLEKTGGGTGHGSSLLVRPGPEVFWTRTYGLSPMPWSRFAVSTGELSTVKGRRGLHGDLRDAILESDSRHAWALCTHGLARIDLEAMEEIELVSDGLPTYLSRLVGLSEDLLGAAGGMRKGLVVVDRARRTVIRKLRIPAPDLVEQSGPNEVLLLSLLFGELRLLDLTTLQSKRVREIEVGTGVFRVGDLAWFLQGPIESHEGSPSLRRIRVNQLAAMHIPTLTVKRHGGDFEGARRVLGVDHAGRVVLLTTTGIALADPDMLETVAGLEMMGPRGEPSSCWAAALLPDRRSAVCLPNRYGSPERLLLLRW